MDKQIIIYGVKTTRKDFVDNFAIELTNRNIKEREQIGNKYFDIIQAKEQECERLEQGYAELTEIVSPYMGDSTGYNEELGGFDIVLCVKELLQQLDQLKAELSSTKGLVTVGGKQLKETIEAYDQLKEEHEKLKVWKSITPLKTKMLIQTLTEIKNIVETCNSGINCSECPYAEECRTDTEAEALGVCKLIQQKLEVLGDI